jgi:integrin beta 2
MACVTNAECSEIEAMYCRASCNDYAVCLEECHARLPLPEFVCSDGSRIPASYTCDLVEDCPEGEDEDCPEGMFVCESGLSIEAGWECDGVEDCPEGDDERDCARSPMVSCGDGSTIVASRECDGNVDCATGVDEQDCAKLICE